MNDRKADVSQSDAARLPRTEKHLKKLRAENRKLRLENRALKHEIEQLSSENSKFSNKNEYTNAFMKNAQRGQLFQKKNFSSYMIGLIRSTTFFHIYTEIINTLRKYSFFKITLSILSAVFVFVESSAVLVLSASFFLISIPITLFVSNFTIIVSFFRTRKKIAEAKELLMGKKLTVFLPPKKAQMWGDSYLNGFISSAAKDEDSFCIIVSPYVFKTSGIHASKGSPYYTCRTEQDNIIIVRRHYYFTLRKRVLSRLNSNDITEIY